MFEQAFKNIGDVLWKEAGCTTELDYTEQTSWLLFLAEQKKVATRFDALASETQRLKSIYRQKLTALGELKKSLLHQAFSGAL